MALILFAGYLKNAEISVDALSIWWALLSHLEILSFYGIYYLIKPVA